MSLLFPSFYFTTLVVTDMIMGPVYLNVTAGKEKYYDKLVLYEVFKRNKHIALFFNSENS